MRPCNVARLGLVDYHTAWDLQKRLAAARASGEIGDTLLLLEHPHTYTLGRSGHVENLVWDEAQRAARGVAVEWVDRGGDITYHGPGQLVGYPIMQLREPQAERGQLRANYLGYLRRIEATLVRAAGAFGIDAYTEAGYTGVWTDQGRGPEKIAAIGVRVDVKGVSTHGFALNVNTDLSYFDGIIPCGIDDRPVTSLAALLGQQMDMGAVLDVVEGAFAAEFERELRTVSLDSLPV